MVLLVRISFEKISKVLPSHIIIVDRLHVFVTELNPVRAIVYPYQLGFLSINGARSSLHIFTFLVTPVLGFR